MTDRSRGVVLLVDDDETILTSLKGQLKRRFGTEVVFEVAESAAEAWEVIEELEADGFALRLILSDWLMPETKGDEFLIEVRARYPDLATVMLTGHASPEAITRAFDAAALTHLVEKPWREDHLGGIVAQCLADGRKA